MRDFTTISIKHEDHEKLLRIANFNDRKLIDQFHVIMKNLKDTTK